MKFDGLLQTVETVSETISKLLHRAEATVRMRLLPAAVPAFMLI
jgi:hypothetical protein